MEKLSFKRGNYSYKYIWSQKANFFLLTQQVLLLKQICQINSKVRTQQWSSGWGTWKKGHHWLKSPPFPWATTYWSGTAATSKATFQSKKTECTPASNTPGFSSFLIEKHRTARPIMHTSYWTHAHRGWKLILISTKPMISLICSY